MRRTLLLLSLLAIACFAAAGAGAAPAPPQRQAPAATWAEPQIASVLATGIFDNTAETFRPDDALTMGELADVHGRWGKGILPPEHPDDLVTVRQLDAQLVAALKLLPASRAIRLAARDAGLDPIPSLGTETVARVLGLRLNHPAGHDQLELAPTAPVTRAEAAYSFARALTVPDWAKQQLLAQTARLSFPQLNGLQRGVLGRALKFVGFPYVWTGTSEKARQTLWDGTTVPGGFDCSGFVWRVYKLQPLDGAPGLARTLQGRTTYAMSGEVPAALRVDAAELEPGDVIFFGSHGKASKPTEIGHMGIYVGSGWFVHSSSAGVTLQPFSGWYVNRFAWARRPLAEAGLEAASEQPATASS
jgi:cell wall-associated NlpC family hydrolase